MFPKFLFLFFLLGRLSVSVQGVQTTRFKDAKCTSETPDIIVHECRVKVQSRNESSLAVDVTLIKPVVKPIYVNFEKFYDKNDNNFFNRSQFPPATATA